MLDVWKPHRDNKRGDLNHTSQLDKQIIQVEKPLLM